MVSSIASSAPAGAGKAARGGPRRPASGARRHLAATAAVVALAAATAAPPAFTYPDAQMEARTRPDFGWLLRPPTWPGGPGPGCCGPGPPPVPPPLRPGCRPGFGPPCGLPPGPPGPVGPPVLDHIVVDCTGWRPHMVQRALNLLRPGGVLILRTHGRACIEPLFITRPVQIVGDGGPDVFGPYDHAAFPLAHAVLVAPPGQPCISVAPGVHAVSIRGLVINAPDAGGAACIQARDADVEVRDTVIRYVGLGSAINVEGGTMLLKNLGVAARTPAPAVISEEANVKFEDLRLATTQIGLLVEPGPGDSQLTRVFARALAGGLTDDAHPTTGLMVRGGSGRGHVDILDAVMLGFSNGVRFDHDVRADLRYGRIGWSKVGVLSDGLVGVKGMTIGAAEVGVYVRAGAASVILNRIYGVHFAAIFADPGARVWAAGNRVYPGPDCGFFRDPRYNATGQECRPWTELPEGLRVPPGYVGAFQDGWSEWNFNWGYDWQTDAWRTGPGRFDAAAWAGRAPAYQGGFGYGGGPPGPGGGPVPPGAGPGFPSGPGAGPGFPTGPGAGPGFPSGPGAGPGFPSGPGAGPDFPSGPPASADPPGPPPEAGAGPGPGPGPGLVAGPGLGPGPGPVPGAGPGPGAPGPVFPGAGPAGPPGYTVLAPGVPTYTSPSWGTQQAPLSPDVHNDPDPR